MSKFSFQPPVAMFAPDYHQQRDQLIVAFNSAADETVFAAVASVRLSDKQVEEIDALFISRADELGLSEEDRRNGKFCWHDVMVDNPDFAPMYSAAADILRRVGLVPSEQKMSACLVFVDASKAILERMAEDRFFSDISIQGIGSGSGPQPARYAAPSAFYADSAIPV